MLTSRGLALACAAQFLIGVDGLAGAIALPASGSIALRAGYKRA